MVSLLSCIVESTPLNRGVEMNWLPNRKVHNIEEPFSRVNTNKLKPKGNGILDCSPIAAAGHAIPPSYVLISVSQFMDELAVEELIGNRCDNLIQVIQMIIMRKGEMQTTEDQKIQQNEPVGSVTPRYEANTIQQIGNPWSIGLFDCHENQTDGCHLGSFIYLLMMPALCSQWIMGSKYRTKLTKRYDLVEAPYTDVISHIFCPCCSLCQEFRELKIRGLDPALGWNGILARQHATQQSDQTLKTPPSNQFMSK